MTAPRPDWEALAEFARGQAALFTARQAQDVGFSRPLLVHHVRTGRLTHVGRGLYRISAFPFDEQEEFVAVWLATEKAAVFSHETALQLHGLSDVLPARIHVTLPTTFRRRRLPMLVATRFAEVPEADRAWLGAVPVTTVRRTLADCVAAGVQQSFIDDAMTQALNRGVVTEAGLEEIRRGFTQS